MKMEKEKEMEKRKMGEVDEGGCFSVGVSVGGDLRRGVGDW